MLTTIKVDAHLKIHKLEDVMKLPFKVHVNDFNEASAKKFEEEMQWANSTNQEVIPVIIDSYGGQVYSLLSMIDTIKQAKKTVATIISGKAMSCGALLASCGAEGFRFCSPHATIMIHDVSSWAMGKVEEIKSSAEEVERLNQLVYRLMARNCGKDEEYFLNLVHEKGHADWYLTSIEAKEHNLVNHIRIPEFQVEISAKIKFV